MARPRRPALPPTARDLSRNLGRYPTQHGQCLPMRATDHPTYVRGHQPTTLEVTIFSHPPAATVPIMRLFGLLTAALDCFWSRPLRPSRSRLPSVPRSPPTAPHRQPSSSARRVERGDQHDDRPGHRRRSSLIGIALTEAVRALSRRLGSRRVAVACELSLTSAVWQCGGRRATTEEWMRASVHSSVASSSHRG